MKPSAEIELPLLFDAPPPLPPKATLPEELRQLPALSIRGPWWWFILHAGKLHENRNWFGTYRVREMGKLKTSGGRFIIHAASGCTHDEFDSACEGAKRIGVTKFPEFDSMLRGGFVGTARVLSFVETSQSPWAIGPGLELADPVGIDFVPYSGQLGFFIPKF